MKNRYIELKEFILSVNPRLAESVCQSCDRVECDFSGLKCPYYKRPVITLASVFIAISKSGLASSLLTAMIHKDGVMTVLGINWNLLNDNLDEQTDETKEAVGWLFGI